MKYLFFDEYAIENIVSKTYFQSAEYAEGKKLLEYLKGNGCSGVFDDIYIEIQEDGVMFSGKKNNGGVNTKVFCVDILNCDLYNQVNNDSELLTVFQKMFRTAIKVWSKSPFSSAERISGTKIIIFPFVFPDSRRMVIERSIDITQLKHRGIEFPLLAYNFCSEEPHREDKVDTSVIKKAGHIYSDKKHQFQKSFQTDKNSKTEGKYTKSALGVVETKNLGKNDGFEYLPYEVEYNNLTDTQKTIVDSDNLSSPIRISGAAGTGKTVSMLLRAFKLLKEAKEQNREMRIIFMCHSSSTYQQNLDFFNHFDGSQEYIDSLGQQSITFKTLMTLTGEIAGINSNMMLDYDAGDAKSYQLMLIDKVLKDACDEYVIDTYKSFLSDDIKKLFLNVNEESSMYICSLLQHEFSVQIKGRTDGTFEQYKELKPIENGLKYVNEKDKELIYRLYTNYNKELQSLNNYDVDDIVIEALSKLNAPIWRRERAQKGYDYIFVDEMHLFNINEQSVFHYLTKNIENKEIPICFCLDYCQAIGDRGDTKDDFIEKMYSATEEKKLRTVFRNSPQISELCASIAASGTLMFKKNFANPYEGMQNVFTHNEEKNFKKPEIKMVNNDDEMYASLNGILEMFVQELQCKHKDIAIISFIESEGLKEVVEKIKNATNKNYAVLDNGDDIEEKKYVIATPYSINGLGFQAVILLGIDEGRVPQTQGTSDIANNYINYSAYNMLYLASSRAKYRLIMLGTKLRGMSSCLEHSIKEKYIDVT